MARRKCPVGCVPAREALGVLPTQLDYSVEQGHLAREGDVYFVPGIDFTQIPTLVLERGDDGFFRATTPTGRTPLVLSQNEDALRKWCKKRKVKRVESLDGLGTLGPSVRPDMRTVGTPGYAFHATNVERAHEIATSGLQLHLPHEFTDQETWPDGEVEPRNYFSANAGVVYSFAPEEGRSVILRVPLSAHPFKRESTGDLYSTQVVPPELIEILTQGGWYSLKTWAASGLGNALNATITPPLDTRWSPYIGVTSFEVPTGAIINGQPALKLEMHAWDDSEGPYVTLEWRGENQPPFTSEVARTTGKDIRQGFRSSPGRFQAFRPGMGLPKLYTVELPPNEVAQLQVWLDKAEEHGLAGASATGT